MSKNYKTLTMVELARLANVSVGTVSRALRRPQLVKTETRERIMALVREYDFTINAAASGLRRGETRAIGVIIPMGHDRAQHISDPFFMSLIGQIADNLAERNYNLLLSRVLPDDDEWLDRMVRAHLFDGVIIIGQSDQHDVIRRVAGYYAPLVVWGQFSEGNDYITVGSDNHVGGRIAASHLFDQGCEKLVFLGDPAAPEIDARLSGCRLAASTRQKDQVIVVKVDLDPDAAHDQLTQWLRKKPIFDGIVAASDVVAMSALRALDDHGLSVPAQVKVVGYDDLPLAGQTRPPLSSVRQDLAIGARELVRLLFTRINNEPAQSLLMKPILIARKSTEK